MPSPPPLPPDFATQLHSPALLIHLDRARANIRHLLTLLPHPTRWRPHLKTTKIPEVWQLLVDAGVRHFKCATPRELSHLAPLLPPGADVLLAHPPYGPTISHLATLSAQYPHLRLSTLTESPTHLATLPASVSVFIDLNPGYDRTGLPLTDPDAILDLARAAGPRLRGLHFYEGHLTDLDLATRRRQAFACYDELLALVEILRGAGFPPEEVLTSGTPTFRFALEHPGLQELNHRVSPGTLVFHDARSAEQNPDFDFTPAAVLFTRVVSHPAHDRVTCDAGSKSIAAEAGDPCALVLDHPELLPETPSEEHLPLRVTRGDLPPRGTELYLVPRHVCPTVNLAEQAVLIDDGVVQGIVPVAARAHDTVRRASPHYS